MSAPYSVTLLYNCLHLLTGNQELFFDFPCGIPAHHSHQPHVLGTDSHKDSWKIFVCCFHVRTNPTATADDSRLQVTVHLKRGRKRGFRGAKNTPYIIARFSVIKRAVAIFGIFALFAETNA